MAQIQVSNLTFCYEGSFDNIFENVSFSIDSNWKLGFIGRNGKGKTTFANLLLGKQEYSGTIAAGGLSFDYFPYQTDDAGPRKHTFEPTENIKFGDSASRAATDSAFNTTADSTSNAAANSAYEKTASELLEQWKPNTEEWRVICELSKLDTDAEILYRPFQTLSQGERMKVMLAVLFSGENEFLIIDEPTNHLDYEARNSVKEYLKTKKGFILISHDRDFLDGVIDHVLMLNRKTIEVQAGNFSSWWENKKRRDSFAEAENEKHLKEIASLKKSADRSARWADKNEAAKIGFDPVKEPDRCASTRSYIGAKTKKMQSRVKSYEKRMEREIQDKEGLLEDIEKPAILKLSPLGYHKETLIYARDFCLRYPESETALIKNFNFTLKQGERIFLHGKNGCGKSTLLRQILAAEYKKDLSGNPLKMSEQTRMIPYISGELKVASGLKISYIDQDTHFLHGSLKEYCKKNGYDESLLLAILRQLDMERTQFEKPMEDYSEGQKKKVLIAGSLLTPAHLYIWDEPLNYIDVFSRMQIENLILEYRPTMLIVEHDVRFREKIATKVVENFRI